MGGWGAIHAGESVALMSCIIVADSMADSLGPVADKRQLDSLVGSRLDGSRGRDSCRAVHRSLVDPAPGTAVVGTSIGRLVAGQLRCIEEIEFRLYF